MKVTTLSLEEILSSDARSYNPAIWAEKAHSYSKYKDVTFYVNRKEDSANDYDRYFVEYTLPEGLRLLNSFGYSSGLSAGGFYRLDKQQVTAEGKEFGDVLKLAEEGKIEDAQKLIAELQESKIVYLSLGKFATPEGEMVTIGTNPEARRWMIDRCKSGLTFTKGF